MVLELATLLAMAVIGVILFYTLSMFKEWISSNIGGFRTRQLLSGLVRERLPNGNNKVIPFLFDRKLKKYLKAEAYEAELLDEKLEEKLEGKKVYINSINND